jgi:hypothetical protein
VSRSRRGPEGLPRRWRTPLLIAGIALVSLVGAPGANAEASVFCHERFVRDYEAPLRDMPGAHPPPRGELPFGPRNFGIHRIHLSPLALDGASFGYRFGGKNEGYRVLDLGWHVVATFRSVSAQGRVRRVLGVREWRARRVKDLDPLQLSLPAERPGFFRVDLRFETLKGRRLASYRDYFRVLRRSTDVGIEIDGQSFHPGEAIFARVANRGAGTVWGAGEFELERDEGDGWLQVALSPTPESVRRIRWLIGPGEAGPCHRLELPAAAGPGVYRLSMPIYVVNEQKRRTFESRFEIRS